MIEHHKRTSKEKRKLRTRMQVRQAIRKNNRVRLIVNRTANHIYAQVISKVGQVLAVASSVEKAIREATSEQDKKGVATVVGNAVAERAIKAGVKQVAFDRNGFQYHGRIRALADAAREQGLEF